MRWVKELSSQIFQTNFNQPRNEKTQRIAGFRNEKNQLLVCRFNFGKRIKKTFATRQVKTLNRSLCCWLSIRVFSIILNVTSKKLYKFEEHYPFRRALSPIFCIQLERRESTAKRVPYECTENSFRQTHHLLFFCSFLSEEFLQRQSNTTHTENHNGYIENGL